MNSFPSYQQQQRMMEADSEFKPPTDSSELLDRAQALHTALCYLCNINADIAHVQDFLFHHPEAVLLEGASDDPAENAASMLKAQEKACQCLPRSPCRQNRRAILQLLHCGYSFVQSRSMEVLKQEDWHVYEVTLVDYEKEIRLLRHQEFTARQFALEASVQIQKYQDELKLADQYRSHKPKFTRFLCGNHHEELFARCSVLEYQIGSARVELTSLERLHEAVLAKIKNTRQLQYQVLRHALPCSLRHRCESDDSGTTFKMGDHVTLPSWNHNIPIAAVSTEEFSI